MLFEIPYGVADFRRRRSRSAFPRCLSSSCQPTSWSTSPRLSPRGTTLVGMAHHLHVSIRACRPLHRRFANQHNDRIMAFGPVVGQDPRSPHQPFYPVERRVVQRETSTRTVQARVCEHYELLGDLFLADHGHTAPGARESPRLLGAICTTYGSSRRATGPGRGTRAESWSRRSAASSSPDSPRQGTTIRTCKSSINRNSLTIVANGKPRLYCRSANGRKIGFASNSSRPFHQWSSIEWAEMASRDMGSSRKWRRTLRGHPRIPQSWSERPSLRLKYEHMTLSRPALAIASARGLDDRISASLGAPGDREIELELSRWPFHLDRALTATGPVAIIGGMRIATGRALPRASAKLSVDGGEPNTVSAGPGAKSVGFEVSLAASRHTLQGWCLNESGKDILGAYFERIRPQ